MEEGKGRGRGVTEQEAAEGEREVGGSSVVKTKGEVGEEGEGREEMEVEWEMAER